MGNLAERTATAAATAGAVLCGVLTAASPAAADTGPATGTVSSAATGYNLLVWDNATTPDRPVATGDPTIWGHFHRNWTFTPKEGGKYYTIKQDRERGGCLTYKQSSWANWGDYTAVPDNCLGGTNQDWIVKPSGQGDSVTISPRNAPGKVLTEYKSGVERGAYSVTVKEPANTSHERWRVPEGVHATPRAKITKVPGRTGKIGGTAQPAVTVENIGDSPIGKQTVTLTLSPDLYFLEYREVYLDAGTGVRKVPCTVISDRKATCPDVPLDISSGQSRGLWTEVGVYSGAPLTSVPHVTFAVGDLGSARAHVRLHR